MNNLESFEDVLIDNDFSVQEKPIFNIPKGIDVQTQYGLRAQAYFEMQEANLKIARSVASEKHELLEQLTELYLKTSNVDRQKIRDFLRDIDRWRDVFRNWKPKSTLMIEDPKYFLRLFLANHSMLNGGADYRDTILSLAMTWHTIEELGVDPEPDYRAAQTWGGNLVECIDNVLDPTLRRANCLKCQTGEPHLESR